MKMHLRHLHFPWVLLILRKAVPHSNRILLNTIAPIRSIHQGSGPDPGQERISFGEDSNAPRSLRKMCVTKVWGEELCKLRNTCPLGTTYRLFYTYRAWWARMTSPFCGNSHRVTTRGHGPQLTLLYFAEPLAGARN